MNYKPMIARLKKTLWVLVTVCTVAIFIRFVAQKIDWYSSYIMYPILKMHANYVDPTRAYFQERSTAQELSCALKALMTDYTTLSARYIQLLGTSDFNAHTQSLQEFSKRYKSDQCRTVQVLARHIGSDAHFILIDAGERENIEKDMVVVHGNSLVGRVIEVYPHYSKVLLITDVRCKVATFCAATKTVGVFGGANHCTAGQLDHISHLMPIQVGDVVLSSGEGGLFARGFGIGTIERFTKDHLLYDITVKPFIDPRSMNYCTVLYSVVPQLSDKI
ncbi:rod shape-determining protein MreC [Vermiphilus pyriformis]|uniref:Cell shape-determining protein MreC n=1 Tax=candidate division TM6 bacterium JCVI TM6SC1 TaxID=1306947 RepID=A0A0D2K542_9BACT|nr:hypothetical protein J120_03525 [candidate division TM6 bacterium JCVI TM6SC1]UNE35427.1 MAG: rod shape-determining protein MreC [Vermiphilus pyriformis]